jgi:hypothetical protein
VRLFYLGFICLIGVLFCSFSLPDKTSVTVAFGQNASFEMYSGKVRGMIFPADTDFFLQNEGALVFFVEPEPGANRLFTDALQIRQHNRDFRSLEVLFSEGHYLAIFDQRVFGWLNPAVLLRED